MVGFGQDIGVGMFGVLVEGFDAADEHGVVFQLIGEFIRAADVELIGGGAVELLAFALDVHCLLYTSRCV